jgi:hypothetical protein
MKKNLLFLMVMLLSPAAHATPPGDLNLTYDLDKQSLTAQGPHPTQDMTEHYIRRMEVSKNGGEVKMFYFPRQNSASEFKETVPFNMEPNDKIHVKVFCSQGGSKEADLAIPEAKSDETAQPVDLKSLKDKEHPNMQVIP